jgi:hypothetical protein
MKMWQRVLFVVLIVGMTFLSIFVVFPVAIWRTPPPFGLTLLLLGEMFAGWLGALIARELIRASKRACSMTAITAVVVVDTVVVVSILRAIGQRLAQRGLSDGMAVTIVLSLHSFALLGATYWRSARVVRLVETVLAVGLWMLVLVLRISSAWPFEPFGPDLNDVGQYRAAGVVLLVVTAPLVVGLILAFWRDRRSHVGGSSAAS